MKKKSKIILFSILGINTPILGLTSCSLINKHFENSDRWIWTPKLLEKDLRSKTFLERNKSFLENAKNDIEIDSSIMNLNFLSFEKTNQNFLEIKSIEKLNEVLEYSKNKLIKRFGQKIEEFKNTIEYENKKFFDEKQLLLLKKDNSEVWLYIGDKNEEPHKIAMYWTTFIFDWLTGNWNGKDSIRITSEKELNEVLEYSKNQEIKRIEQTIQDFKNKYNENYFLKNKIILSPNVNNGRNSVYVNEQHQFIYGKKYLKKTFIRKFDNVLSFNNMYEIDVEIVPYYYYNPVVPLKVYEPERKFIRKSYQEWEKESWIIEVEKSFITENLKIEVNNLNKFNLWKYKRRTKQNLELNSLKLKYDDIAETIDYNTYAPIKELIEYFHNHKDNK